MSKGIAIAIISGVVIAAVILGLLIYYVIYPAIKGQTYNGGGSGNTNFIRSWIDGNMGACNNKYACKNGICTVTTGTVQLLTQDGLYILSYDSKSNIFLSPVQSPKGDNVWYLCFYNKNSDIWSEYNGTLTSANQMCNPDSKGVNQNLCNLFWECDTTKGVQSCTTVYGGYYPPNKIKLDTACATSGKGQTCNISLACGDTNNNTTVPCLNSDKGTPVVEKGVYINSDDTISTLPAYSKNSGVGHLCSDQTDSKDCMGSEYYLGINQSDYSMVPTTIHKLATRFKIVKCTSGYDSVTQKWTCTQAPS